MTKIYLDTCSIQRPLDTLNQTRLRLEAEAILGVLAQVRVGNVELISSTVLELETQRNPLAIRREHGEQILAQATRIVIVDEQIEQRAHYFVQMGIKIMDALHLAAAEAAEADYFCTCDDRFLRRAKMIANLKIRVFSPLELIEAIEE
ncbi:MAG: PIN domain-containing protein [Caldilineaceae bacterium]|nr:PIN domain-containing protein [Caldilineaceae bacterium]